MLKNISIFLLLFSLSFLIIFAQSRGFVPHDEGWFLEASRRMLSGQIPYKDFEFIYNPGLLYINLFAFKLFGVSILSSRILAFANSVIAIIFLFLLGKHLKLTKRQTIAMAFLYAFWGPMQINFVWPVIFCVTGAFAAMHFFSTKQKYGLIFAGLSAGIILLFKQNFGAAAILASMATIFLQRDSKQLKSSLVFAIGLIAILSLQSLYFLETNSLHSYIAEFKYSTITKIVIEGTLNSPLPWEYPQSIILKLIKVLIYLLPAIISLLVFVKLQKSTKRSLFSIPLFTFFFYLLSIRPTTDQVHLAPLIALSAPAIFLLYHESNQKVMKLLTLFLIVSLIALGGFTSLFRNFYRWDTPLIKQGFSSKNTRVGIFVDEKAMQSSNKISAYFSRKQTNEKTLFVYSFAPIFNFILDKSNPSKFDYVHSGILSKQTQNEILTSIEADKTAHILTDTNLNQDSGMISGYIKNKYSPVKKINEYTIWRRNDSE